jgi:hypothetical protein
MVTRLSLVADGRRQFLAIWVRSELLPPALLDPGPGGGKQANLSTGPDPDPCPQQGIASFSATSRPLPALQHPFSGEGLILETI